MVAATKNKRGRPKRELYEHNLYLRNIDNEPYSDRAIQNRTHVETVECFLMDAGQDDIYSFFINKDGITRRRGILEQVGRMMDAGLFKSDRDVIKLLDACITAYCRGLSCKQIEKRLRELRKAAKESALTGAQLWTVGTDEQEQ